MIQSKLYFHVNDTWNFGSYSFFSNHCNKLDNWVSMSFLIRVISGALFEFSLFILSCLFYFGSGFSMCWIAVLFMSLVIFYCCCKKHHFRLLLFNIGFFINFLCVFVWRGWKVGISPTHWAHFLLNFLYLDKPGVLNSASFNYFLKCLWDSICFGSVSYSSQCDLLILYLLYLNWFL